MSSESRKTGKWKFLIGGSLGILRLAAGGIFLYAVTVPRIFEKDGYIFFFYSNDHAPIHVHVRKGDGEAVFVIENGVFLRESEGLKVSELARAEFIAEENKEIILQKWHDYFTQA